MARHNFISRVLARTFGALLLGALVAAGTAALAQTVATQTTPAPVNANPIAPDGTVSVPAFQLPPSAYLSPEARAALPRKPFDPEIQMNQAVAAGKAGYMRAHIGEFMAPRIKHLMDLYPVTLSDTVIAGVPGVIIAPAGAMPNANKHKIILELPGGGFVMGTAHGTGLMESIPLASMAKISMVSITYRQGPEFQHPAAVEDVVAVYRELLKTHKPQDIGVSGCSAGGLLTAEAMAWFQKDKLPLPGAIGIFCASADARFEGDSHYFSRPFQALPAKDGGPDYFKGVDLTDPLVSPIVSPEIMKHFPPTLIITATRAMDLSSAVNTDRVLTSLGVDSEIHIWDGLGHAFFYDIDLPESKEAFHVMAHFFTRHLRLKN